MNTKIVHLNLCSFDVTIIKNSLQQLKATNKELILLCVYITTSTNVRFSVFTSNLIKLTHQQIKTLAPRINQKLQKVIRSYQVALPVFNLTFELIKVTKKTTCTPKKSSTL